MPCDISLAAQIKQIPPLQATTSATLAGSSGDLCSALGVSTILSGFSLDGFLIACKAQSQAYAAKGVGKYLLSSGICGKDVAYPPWASEFEMVSSQRKHKARSPSDCRSQSVTSSQDVHSRGGNLAGSVSPLPRNWHLFPSIPIASAAPSRPSYHGRAGPQRGGGRAAQGLRLLSVGGHPAAGAHHPRFL